MAAVLLDRDGVINENRPDYVQRWRQFRFLPGAVDALGALQAAGLKLAVVTNQSAVGRGLMADEALADIHRRMADALAAEGVLLEGVFVCRHAPWHGCLCRKPRPRLLLEALARLGERKGEAVLVGDGREDLLAARAACMPFVLVRSGRGGETARRCHAQQPSMMVAEGLRSAVGLIAAHFERRKSCALEVSSR